MRRAWGLAAGALVAAGACYVDDGQATMGGLGGAVSSRIATATASATASASSATATGTGGAKVAACNQGMPEVCNPFGIALAPGGLADDAYWSVITRALAVPFYRPDAIFLDQGGACPRCVAAIQHALALVLVVRAGGGPDTPTPPPPDLGTYEAALGAVLDANDAAVAVVVIEDALDTRYAGTAAEYLAELTAGCAVAHAKGARCADGGLGSATVVLLLADYYEALGNTGAALGIVGTAGGDPDVVSAFATWPPTTEEELEQGLAARKVTLDRAKEILAGERAADVDYANFHWYESDLDSFDEAIAFLRNRTGCNAVMIDELGQRGQDLWDAAHKLSDAQDLGLALVIWASGVEPDASSVVDDAGALTPSGTALAAQSAAATCRD